MYKVLFILFNLLLLSNCVLAAETKKINLAPEHVTQLKQDLTESGFSGFVMIADTNAILLHEVFGTANVNSHSAFTQHTQIDIGSVTKTLTGLAASKLMDNGQLKPEDKLSHFFPDVSEDKANITIHQLLTHSSGFPAIVGSDYEYIDQAEFIELALKAPLEFKPGAGYGYSNVGFGLIAAIISKVTQKTYQKWLQDLVMKPLNLKSTGYASVYEQQKAESNMAGEILAQASWGGAKPGWHLIGNGGMVSTAADLLQLGRMLLTAPNRTMLQPYVRESGGMSHYGYGIVLEQDPVLGRLQWHNGGNNFFYTDLYTLPERDLVVILHSNNPLTQSGATERLLATLKGQPLPPLADVKTYANIPNNSSVGNLAQAFLAALKDKTSNTWKQLLTHDAHPEFLAMATMQDHLAMHAMLHDDFKAVDLIGFRELQADNGGIAELKIRGNTSNAIHTISLHYKIEGNRAMITGIGIE